MVGLVPLFAVATIEPLCIERLPTFRKRLEWLLRHRSKIAALVSRWYEPGLGERRLLAILRGARMKRVLARMLDPDEFLSPHGVRSLSRWHEDHPSGWTALVASLIQEMGERRGKAVRTGGAAEG